MKKLTFLVFFISISSTLFAQSRPINRQEAKQIAEKFVSCSGYTTKTLPLQLCGEYKKSCSDDTFPCKFIEKKAFGFFSERGNGERGWTIVFRTRGNLKSKITGVKISMNEDGKDVKIEKKKVLLKFVEKKY